jgi:hypothetical protein
LAFDTIRCGNILINMDIKKWYKDQRLKIYRTKIKIFRPKAFIPRPFIDPEQNIHNKKTLILVVPNTFNQDALRASSLIPLGFAHGWSEVCGPVKIVEDRYMAKELDKHQNPAVYISIYNLDRLSLHECKKLSKVDAFIGVNIYPKMIEEFKKQFRFEKDEIDTAIWIRTYPKLVAAEPKFVWNSAGNSGMKWYQGWIDDGYKWVTLHPAADTVHYFPTEENDRFKNVKMAYVGGYWPEKAQAFDMYFRPWEDIFFPYGYSPWPYKNYQGGLTQDEERQLYSSAGIIPLVTSPGGWLMAEITERYLKAPACKAFCIADQNPALREMFADDEMLQAESPEHFHSLVNDFLKGNIDRDHWKEKAYQAVMERHLYKHRAELVRDNL